MKHLVLDNSAFSLLYCKRRFQLTAVNGLRGADSPTAAFGNAFHTGAEVLDKTNDVMAMIQELAKKDYGENQMKLVEALTLLHLTKKQPPALMLVDGRIGIEVKFLIPSYYQALGYTIDLAGTIDRIHIADDGYLEIVDYKSAADFKEAGQRAKMEEYENSFQLPLYYLACLNGDFLPEHAKALIREGKYRTKYIYIFYNAVPQIIRESVFAAYDPSFIGRAERTLIYMMHEAINVAEAITPAPYTGMSTYKGCTYCPFRPGCAAHNYTEEIAFLTRFTQTPYNPLTFR